MTEASKQVEAIELLARQTGKHMAEKLGENVKPEELSSVLDEEFKTDWEKSKARGGFNQFRIEQGWDPVVLEEEK